MKPVSSLDGTRPYVSLHARAQAAEKSDEPDKATRTVKAGPPPRATAATDVPKDVKEAAAAFESILVRQMLSSAQVAGKSGYADMGVEALSSAVAKGGGLGLGRAIERAVAGAHHAPPVTTPEAAASAAAEGAAAETVKKKPNAP